MDGIELNMKMNILSISGLFVAIVIFPLFIINLKYGRSRVAKLWAMFNLAVTVWGLGSFFVGISSTPEQAICSWRFAHIGVIFIAVFFYHVIFVFCKLKSRVLLYFAYIQG